MECSLRDSSEPPRDHEQRPMLANRRNLRATIGATAGVIQADAAGLAKGGGEAGMFSNDYGIFAAH